LEVNDWPWRFAKGAEKFEIHDSALATTVHLTVALMKSGERPAEYAAARLD